MHNRKKAGLQLTSLIPFDFLHRIKFQQAVRSTALAHFDRQIKAQKSSQYKWSLIVFTGKDHDQTIAKLLSSKLVFGEMRKNYEQIKGVIVLATLYKTLKIFISNTTAISTNKLDVRHRILDNDGGKVDSSRHESFCWLLKTKWALVCHLSCGKAFGIAWKPQVKTVYLVYRILQIRAENFSSIKKKTI